MATIWLTGASSFTAFHLAHELNRRGHRLILSCSRPRWEYIGIQSERLKRLPESVTLMDDTPFGSERMMQWIESTALDAFCHHGSWTKGLQTAVFDLSGAIAWNTHNVSEVFKILASTGCSQVLYTNSYFVQKHTQPSAYALSKHLTEDVLKFYAHLHDLQFSSIVLSNPVGIWDNTRLLEVFFKCWATMQQPTLFVKDWIRDHIWVDDLSHRWAKWIELRIAGQGSQTFKPSGQVDSLEKWIQRFQRAVQQQKGWVCSYHAVHDPPLHLQSMPSVLINTEPSVIDQFSETEVWIPYIDHLEWRLQQGLL